MPRVSLSEFSSMRFLTPDPEQFPCLRVALEAAALGGSACIVLNGANDVAVQRYLQDHLTFTDIPRVIRETLDQHTLIPHPTLDEIVAVDAWSRQTAQELMEQWSLR
jgi:1-deoxy-D-xylulose-5-phosphate reductoisomerase